MTIFLYKICMYSYKLAQFTVTNIQHKADSMAIRLNLNAAVRIYVLLKGIKGQQIMMLLVHLPGLCRGTTYC